jgi:hypothetical protein
MSTLSQFVGGSSSSNVPVELLVVGGGGAGGHTQNVTYVAGGGGGAGELVHLTMPMPKGVAYTIAIGAGGTSTGVGPTTNGSNSSFGTLVAGGGGGGQPSAGRNGSAGTIGSGSGSGGLTTAGRSVGVIGNIDLASFGYCGRSCSFDGLIGSGTYSSTTMINGAGGGIGLALEITGSAVTYATGGPQQVSTAGAFTWSSGTANTGDGGQGAASGNSTTERAGGAGGSGIVIIAYPSTFAAPASISGTYTTPSRSGYRVYRFTGSGSITL